MSVYIYILYDIIFIINSEGSITGMSPHQKMEVMPNTDYNSNNSIHTWQVGPDTYCSLLLSALFHWGPHTPTLLGSTTHFQESTFFLTCCHTCQSSLRTLYTLLDVCSALMYLNLLKLRFTMSHHNHHISIPGNPRMIISPLPEFPLSSWYGTVHHEFFCVL